MSQKILLKRSNVIESGKPKLPSPSTLEFGELAINYASSVETLSIKNSSGNIVTFSSDSELETLASAPTETTILRTDGKAYKIGDEVRVSSSDEGAINGYKFYKLYDLTENNTKAYWSESDNGGGGDSPFETCVVTLNVNTGSTTMLSGAVVTCYLEDGSLYASYKYNGSSNITFKHSPGIKYYISVSSVDNFVTPSKSEVYVASYANNRTVPMLYKTCEITANISGYPSSATPYVTLSYNDGGGKNIVLYNGQKTYVKYGLDINLTYTTIDGYYIPNQIDKINSNNDYNVINATYEKGIIYSILINQTVSNPYTMISSAITGNSRDAIEWIRNYSHRYLGTYVSGEDMMYLCQLDDNNSEKFLDGTTAYLTGGQGDVFMKLPKFYYKAENIGGNNWKINFSMGKVDSTWKTWEGNDLIGTFEAIYNSSKLRSIKSSLESSGNISWTTFREYARNRYGENHGKIVTWEQHCIMAFLFYAYYCNTNSQAQCGSGYSSSQKPCGQQLSMIDTNSSNGNTEDGINFWGLENWWGNKGEWIDNASGGSNEFVITTYDGTTGAWGSNRTATAYNVGNYFSHMTVGEYLDASALDSTTATDSTGYCDYFLNGSSYAIVHRSEGSSIPYGGVACAGAYSSPSNTSTGFCSRLSYVGPWTLLTSTEYMQKFPVGVFIQDINGNLYKTSEWDGTKTPNGIALLTSNVRVLLALTTTIKTMSNSNTNPLEGYTTGTTDEYKAILDYNGKTNTTNIMTLIPSTSYAAGWCNSFTFPDGKTKGYLPALGELYEIYKNRTEVNAALSACGGTEMDTCWSSTFCGVDNDYRRFWRIHWSSSFTVYKTNLTSTTEVRAVASLD